MKKCEEYELAISCYVDGELAREEKAKLFSHLASCERCTGFFEQAIEIRLETAKEQRYRLDESVPPEGFRDKPPVPHIANGRRVLALLHRRISIPVPIAAAVVVLFLLLTVYLGGEPQQPKQQIAVHSTLPVQITTLPVVRIP